MVSCSIKSVCRLTLVGFAPFPRRKCYHSLRAVAYQIMKSGLILGLLSLALSIPAGTGVVREITFRQHGSRAAHVACRFSLYISPGEFTEHVRRGELAVIQDMSPDVENRELAAKYKRISLIMHGPLPVVQQGMDTTTHIRLEVKVLPKEAFQPSMHLQLGLMVNGMVKNTWPLTKASTVKIVTLPLCSYPHHTKLNLQAFVKVKNTIEQLSSMHQVYVFRPLTQCSSNPCLNGGTCQKRMACGKFTHACLCPLKFTGPNCDPTDHW